MVFDALGVLVVRQVLARVRFLALGSRLQAFTVEQYSNPGRAVCPCTNELC